MTTTFKGEYVSFWIRLAKKYIPLILLMVFISFKIEYGKPMFTNYKIYWYSFIAICFIIGIYYNIRDIRTVVTEVTFVDDRILISGNDFNKKFKDNLKVDETLIEIKQKENNKFKIYLEIYSNDKYYYINSYSNWSNQTLVNLINEYKSKTAAKITGMEFFSRLIESK